MTWLQSIIIAIVEGITEFLPISSTGHMILSSAIMGIAHDEFVKLYEVCIQLGAILSVVVLYWRRFFDFSKLRFYVKLIVAFIPSAIFGVLFSSKIDALLESPTTVAIAFIAGGIVLLFIDRVFSQHQVEDMEAVKYPRAFFIGCFQVLAMIPGVSRSAATIIGGMQQKLSRKLAAEFSFFLAVPTMIAATVKKLWDFKEAGFSFQPGQLPMLFIGNLVAFLVALLAIRSFIRFLQRHDFRVFGVYRILAGAVILVLIWKGIIH
ncbi:MAG: undecaprenyl-diphosphate phosphatase [Bacteroidetes bacterium]|nr:undecaprenyl-diphosphate phosphatase [Bacteroidota bacterium]MBS1629710.1 undecaprenyl-diphosphate phosphatase [Bacteroidota bacterium]